MADYDPAINQGMNINDPNQQTGTDQFGNPTNAYGLPLGQMPQRQPTGGDMGLPDAEGGFIQDLGDAFSSFGRAYMGESTFNPMEGAPTAYAPSMTADRMQAAGMDTQQADADRAMGLQARGQQGQLGRALMDRATGAGGPSVAELQMQRGVGLAQQAAARQAASARGINRGLAAYGAMNTQANLASQGVQDAAALRAQEQIAAQGLASKHFSDQRMQDLTSRGMSIQQAQAIMDAENRAREANMNATNRARETNLGAVVQTNQMNLASDTALRQAQSGAAEQEAARRQKAAGGIVATVGSLVGLSDINAKQDVRPLLYSSELAAVPATPNEPSVAEQSRNLEQDRKLGQALDRMGNQTRVQLSQPAMPAFQPQPVPIDDYQMAPPPQEGGGGIGDILGGLSLSDKKAKTDAFIAGVKAASMPVPVEAPRKPPSPFKPPPQAPMGKVGAMPVFDISPERINRMADFELERRGREEQQTQAQADLQAQRQMAFDRLKVMQQTPLDETGTSDKRAKYSYSDARAKELESENEMLKSALSRMGNDTASAIRGDSVPTARFADASADAARDSLGPMQPYQYRYKDEFAAKQGTDTDPRLGIMAQDAMKSPAYQSSVVKMPDGMLGIDQNRLLHANTAVVAGQDKRLQQVEAQNAALAEALTKMGNQKEREILGDDEVLGRALIRMGGQRSREVQDF